jgi:hypothetical protein
MVDDAVTVRGMALRVPDSEWVWRSKVTKKNG